MAKKCWRIEKMSSVIFANPIAVRLFANSSICALPSSRACPIAHPFLPNARDRAAQAIGGYRRFGLSMTAGPQLIALATPSEIILFRGRGREPFVLS